MAINWNGPFSALAVPVAGWSNYMSGSSASTLIPRMTDGDFVSGWLLDELAGNLNFLYIKDRKVLWNGTFVSSESNSTGMTTQGFKYPVSGWSDARSIFAIHGPVFLYPNAARGQYQAPELAAKIRAHTLTYSNITQSIRLYTLSDLDIINGWENYIPPSGSYCEFTVTSSTYTNCDISGWTNYGIIPSASFSYLHLQCPVTGTVGCSQFNETYQMATFMVLTYSGTSIEPPATHYPNLAAINVIEELYSGGF